MSELAMLEMEAGNFDLAVSALKKAALKGDEKSIYQLARIYAQGIGVKKDTSKAETLLRKISTNESRMLLADILCTESGTIGYIESLNIYNQLAVLGSEQARYKSALVLVAMGKNDIASAGFLAVINSESASDSLKKSAKKNLMDLESADAF